jgi:hypothetical protein
MFHFSIAAPRDNCFGASFPLERADIFTYCHLVWEFDSHPLNIHVSVAGDDEEEEKGGTPDNRKNFMMCIQ